jgi:hypothetical protein
MSFFSLSFFDFWRPLWLFSGADLHGDIGDCGPSCVW